MSDIENRVKKIVVEHLGIDESKVVETASFIDDLGDFYINFSQLFLLAVKVNDFRKF